MFRGIIDGVEAVRFCRIERIKLEYCRPVGSRTASTTIRQIWRALFIIMTKKKQCTKCGDWYPPGGFHRDSGRPDGRTAHCKQCKKKYYRQNREKLIAAAEKWNEENKDAYLERLAQYRNSKYRNDPEYREDILRKTREYQANNPEKVRKWKRIRSIRRRARERNADGDFTAEEFEDLCEKYGNRCLCCGNKGDLTADHIVPLASGGSNDIDNIQPLCINCNCRKAVTTIDYRPYYEI